MLIFFDVGENGENSPLYALQPENPKLTKLQFKKEIAFFNVVKFNFNWS